MIYNERVTAGCNNGQCPPHLQNMGCITPPPVKGQCSFYKENAVELCKLWKECKAINCNIFRNDCQVRKKYTIENSFGEAYAFTKKNETRKCRKLVHNEKKNYYKLFKNNYFLYDALYVYNNFFRYMKYPGFFVESGALDGSVHGSNSFFLKNI